MQTSPLPDDVPLSIEPIEGWRVWRLERYDGVLTLASTGVSSRWSPKDPVQARCLVGEHGDPVAGPDCTCGYYATSSPKALAAAGVFRNRPSVVGTVSMWGRVTEHARGARSEFAYPTRLRLVCSECLATGRGAVEPKVVVVSAERLTAACRRHEHEIHGDSMPAREVQGELLSTYAVDLLPVGDLSKDLRVPRDPTRIRRLRTSLFRRRRSLRKVIRDSGRSPIQLVGLGIWYALTGLFAAYIVLGALVWALIVVGAVVEGVLTTVKGGPEASASVSPPALPVVVGPVTATVGAGHESAPQPAPKPFAKFRVVCGHGYWWNIDLVPCGAPNADLLGMAQATRGRGPLKDCFATWVAYSRGPHYWICWSSFEPHPNVWEWASAPDPFTRKDEWDGYRKPEGIA